MFLFVISLFLDQIKVPIPRIGVLTSMYCMMYDQLFLLP